MANSVTRRLVADIGGTNSRLALYDPAADALSARQSFVNREHESLEAIIGGWLESLDTPPPEHCCLAVAAPPAGDRVKMLNIDWSFSCSELAARFGFSRLRCINDFEGNAQALPYLSAEDFTTLHPGLPNEGASLATVGPGTGLGGATLSYIDGRAFARASEPGHMGLAAATELELELFRYLRDRHGEVYAELLVSGPGLQRLYLALADIREETAEALSPEDIATRALAAEDASCELSLGVFCGLLGSVCGDFVLANGAYGGLYLAGGIVPRIISFLAQSSFAERFRTKGTMASYLERVPLHVITSDSTGLIGAAHAPM
jgi:glucokinase